MAVRRSKRNFYVNNIFVKLYDIYQKKTKYSSESDVHFRMITSAARSFIKRIRSNCLLSNRDPHGSHSNCHFSKILSTHWGHDIREKLIRPLFIEAGLISKDDHHKRLLFFTTLESDCRYIQSQKNEEGDINERMSIKIENGMEYAIYGLNFENNKLLVTLDLFSAHYPFVSTLDINYVTKLLNQLPLMFPLIPKSNPL